MNLQFPEPNKGQPAPNNYSGSSSGIDDPDSLLFNDTNSPVEATFDLYLAENNDIEESLSEPAAVFDGEDVGEPTTEADGLARAPSSVEIVSAGVKRKTDGTPDGPISVTNNPHTDKRPRIQVIERQPGSEKPIDFARFPITTNNQRPPPPPPSVRPPPPAGPSPRKNLIPGVYSKAPVVDRYEPPLLDRPRRVSPSPSKNTIVVHERQLSHQPPQPISPTTPTNSTSHEKPAWQSLADSVVLRLKLLESELKQLKQLNARLESEKLELSSENIELREINEKLETENNELREQARVDRGKLEKAEQAERIAREDLRGLQFQLSSLKPATDSQSHEITTLKSELEQSRKKIQSLENGLKNSKKANGETIAKLNHEITILTSKLEKAHKKPQSLENGLKNSKTANVEASAKLRQSVFESKTLAEKNAELTLRMRLLQAVETPGQLQAAVRTLESEQQKARYLRDEMAKIGGELARCSSQLVHLATGNFEMPAGSKKEKKEEEVGFERRAEDKGSEDGRIVLETPTLMEQEDGQVVE